MESLGESTEDYLEKILMLSERNGSVRSIDLARELHFSKPSISIAMKKLVDKGYVIMGDDKEIHLTEAGHEAAAHTYERHKTLIKLLTILGVEQGTAEEDACRIEHDISDETFERIKEFVNK
ncbi:MAG: metal-dependent transcriptional regulator [Lachnospiraceae bacterium]|nr:metal-dependent transcriptional regulator [Lachnospiraceae bacterium]